MQAIIAKRLAPATTAWALVAVWMAVIFCFSTESFSSAHTTSFLAPLLPRIFPNITAPQIENVNLGLRKLGHLSEFFILALLLFRAFHISSGINNVKRSAARAAFIAFIFAASDEWHQSFVRDRTASLGDVMVDTIGAACGLLFTHLRRRWKANFKLQTFIKKLRSCKKT